MKQENESLDKYGETKTLAKRRLDDSGLGESLLVSWPYIVQD